MQSELEKESADEEAALAPANDNQPQGERTAAIGDVSPRTRYVHRNLLNLDDLRAWAKAQE